jgi:hypothetical protein
MAPTSVLACSVVNKSWRDWRNGRSRNKGHLYDDIYRYAAAAAEGIESGLPWPLQFHSDEMLQFGKKGLVVISTECGSPADCSIGEHCQQSSLVPVLHALFFNHHDRCYPHPLLLLLLSIIL